MTRILPTALLMGVIVGLLVAAFMNIFNVPVMEWAIGLEGCDIDRAGCAEQLANPEEEEPLPLAFLITLGGQRVGMSLGLAVIGILFGAVFAGLYYLARNATPGWSPWAWATVAGLLGFWGVSMYTQLKFPLNPPGIGDEGTLLARQGFQFLFMAVNTIAVALVIYGVGLVNRSSVGIRALAQIRRNWIGLRRCRPLAGLCSAQREGRRAGLAATGTHHNVPHIHRRGALPVVDGNRLCQRRLSAVPRTRYPRLSRIICRYRVTLRYHDPAHNRTRTAFPLHRHRRADPDEAGAAAQRH